jgi:hypothetical protein
MTNMRKLVWLCALWFGLLSCALSQEPSGNGAKVVANPIVLTEVEVAFEHPLSESPVARQPEVVLDSARSKTGHANHSVIRDRQFLVSAGEVLSAVLAGHTEKVPQKVELDTVVVLCFTTKDKRKFTLAVDSGLKNSWVDVSARPCTVPEVRELLRILPFSIYPVFEVLRP